MAWSISADGVHIRSQEDFAWYSKAVGEPFALRDDLAGIWVPPTDHPEYRFVKLTAADAYNAGALTSETVTGSAPLVTATAVISLAGSPINGKTVNLLNTERRFLRAGDSGILQDDALQNITGTWINDILRGSSSTGAMANWGTNGSGVSGGTNTGSGFSFDASRVARTANETRAKNQGITMYMRIK